eukprot:Sspe_Gene.33405::Locus_16309_Transcript_1_1_Confidence_1.000_Length_537::g.33405::m.33405
MASSVSATSNPSAPPAPPSAFANPVFCTTLKLMTVQTTMLMPACRPPVSYCDRGERPVYASRPFQEQGVSLFSHVCPPPKLHRRAFVCVCVGRGGYPLPRLSW